jgi:small redox-active disulfide protein 1
MVIIEVMKTSTCSFCPMAIEVVNKVAKEFGDKVNVKILPLEEEENMKRAKGLGVTAVPVILINGMMRFTGVPKEENLKSAIEQALSEEDEKRY